MPGSLLKASISRAGYRGSFSLGPISFEVDEGEVLLITGRSGSGKTTLVKGLLGLLRLDPGGFLEGRILYRGRPLESLAPELLYSRVAYIPQEPWHGIIAHTVASEFCLSLSQSRRPCDLSRLRDYGLLGIAWSNTYTLSAGEYQRLLWACALERGVELLVMDEPLVYVDADGRAGLTGMIERLLSSGASVVIVDHEPSRWSHLDPRLLVLEHGRVSYYGAYRDQALPEAPGGFKVRPRNTGNRVLDAESIWYSYPGSKHILRGVSLEVRRGEVVGVTGANGSGKTTLLKVLAGILKPRRGQVRVSGSIAYLPEDPILYFTHPTLREELESIPHPSMPVDEVVESLGLQGLLDKPLAKLSSGERRRAALASIMLRGPDIILLDEPTGGLDSYSIEPLIRALEYLLDRGVGVVIASHDQRIAGVFTRTCRLGGGVLDCR